MPADRPWKGTTIPCDQSDMALFRACYSIKIGNGKKAKFWTDRWLDGEAPGEFAPGLFKLARRKNLTVSQAIDRGKWMMGLQRINTEDLIEAFVKLWDKLQAVHLTNLPDSISWNMLKDLVYSAKSAYEAQLITRIPQPHLEEVWRARVEGKIRFFLWLLLRNRLWTADRLSFRGWPHQDACSLCDQRIESAKHLIVDCIFAKEVWQLIGTNSTRISEAAAAATVKKWWFRIRQAQQRDNEAKKEITLAYYVVWNIWKERNRRIFEGKSKSTQVLVSMIREDEAQFENAFGR